MSNTVLFDARQDVRGYVNDRQRNADGTYGRRWSDAQVDRTIHSAISSCVDLFSSKGGDQFIEEVELSLTSADAGAKSLLAYDPLRIVGVLVASSSSSDGYTYPVRPADPNVRGAKDTASRNLIVRLVRRPKMPTEDTDLLIGVTDGAMRSWPAFDRWVCMVAALELGIEDRDARQELVMTEADRRKQILETIRIPASLPWPRERRRWLWDLRWLWIPRTATMQMQFAGVRGW